MPANFRPLPLSMLRFSYTDQRMVETEVNRKRQGPNSPVCEITDDNMRKMPVREIQDIKSKLDGYHIKKTPSVNIRSVLKSRVSGSSIGFRG